MASLGKDELKKEIAAILKDADLTTISSKKVRQQIEEKLEVDLTSRKKEVDQWVMEYIDKDKVKGKKNGDVEDEEEEDDDENEDEEDEDDEDEEEEKEKEKPKRGAPKKAAPKRKKSTTDESEEAEESEEDEDDEYSPKKKPAAKKGAKKGRKKKDDSDDSDEEWGKSKRKPAAKKAGGSGGAKRTGGGYTRSIKLSAELAAVVGEESMPRHEVVKRVWAIIKERNLYDPKNKQFAICDDELLKVFGVKRFRTFGMMKFLKNHFLD